MITIFILDGLIHNFFAIDVLIFYFYFSDNRYSFWIGLAYDIIYSETLFLHAFLFYVFSYFISKIKGNIYYFLLLIVAYHLLEYGILVMTKVHIFQIQDFYLLLKIIMVNIILALICNLIHKKKVLT